MAERYIISKDFTPYGLLFESGQIIYFDNDIKEKIDSIKKEIYHIEHSNNSTIKDILSRGKKGYLPDLIMSLQLAGFLVDVVTLEFTQNMKEELEKL